MSSSHVLPARVCGSQWYRPPTSDSGQPQIAVRQLSTAPVAVVHSNRGIICVGLGPRFVARRHKGSGRASCLSGVRRGGGTIAKEFRKEDLSILAVSVKCPASVRRLNALAAQRRFGGVGSVGPTGEATGLGLWSLTWTLNAQPKPELPNSAMRQESGRIDAM
jgi:hypothetical protein